MQGIGAQIVGLSWIVVLVANDERLGFLGQLKLGLSCDRNIN